MQQPRDPNETRRLPRPRFWGRAAAGWGPTPPWLGVPFRVTVGTVLLVLALAAFAFLGPRFVNVATPPQVSPTPLVTPSVVAQSSPTPPPATPEGTPGPPPSQPVESSAPSVTVLPTPAQATPTPSPQPGLWRIDGYVVDEAGKPLKDVCVTGPRGCFPYTPHTDERGYWFIDVAQPTNGITTTFDFYFEMPGRETVWWHFVPTGPIEFNVVLRPK